MKQNGFELNFLLLLFFIIEYFRYIRDTISSVVIICFTSASALTWNHAAGPWWRWSRCTSCPADYSPDCPFFWTLAVGRLFYRDGHGRCHPRRWEKPRGRDLLEPFHHLVEQYKHEWQTSRAGRLRQLLQHSETVSNNLSPFHKTAEYCVKTLRIYGTINNEFYL